MKQLSNPPKRSFIRWLFETIDSRTAIYLLFGGFIVCSLLFDAYARLFGGPEIVVYLDKNAEQPAILPLPETQVVTGERAALWWTVFNKSIEQGNSPHDARFVANSAVDSVYGPPK